MINLGSDRPSPPLTGDQDTDSRLLKALQYLDQHLGQFRPALFVTLGSGLGEIASAVTPAHAFSYSQIPGLTAPKVGGHAGQLIFGNWSGRPVMIAQGRLHYYEGHHWGQVTLPVRLAIALGCRSAVFTNMSGAVNSELFPGQLVVIDDHMNFMGTNPLIGTMANDPAMKFPDMQEAYSPRLRAVADYVAQINMLPIAHGVYAAMAGPAYETPAEIRALRLLGADVVGMSTVGEVLVARQHRLECFAVSCVGNAAAGLGNGPITHEEVLESGGRAVRDLATLLNGMLAENWL